LRSLRIQDLTDFEIIVVDDGSSDGTREWLQTQVPWVRTVSQANRGAGAARNLGANHARGDYLAFLDSDDVWFSWTLATYAEVIRRNHEPSFVTGSPFIFSAEIQLAAVRPDLIGLEAFKDYYASSDAWRWFSASSFVVRRDCFEDVGGFHEKWGAEDADLAMMLGTQSGFVHVTSPRTFGYREQTESLKTMPTYSQAGSKLMIAKENQNLYPGGNQRKRNRVEILTRQIRPVINQCLQHQRYYDAWELYADTFRWHCALGRWKYLLTAPLLAGPALIRGRQGVSS
jgi:glycosyltransferase involved in cell wall biosynthesis